MTQTIKVLITQTDCTQQLHYVPGIREHNLQNLMHEGNLGKWISFVVVVLWMQSVGIPPKNGEQTIGLSITKMLQHTGRLY